MLSRLRHLLAFVVSAGILARLRGATIDNGVIGDPKVECTGEQVGITFATQKVFTGRVFVRGYSSQKECAMSGTDRPPVLNLGFTQCGVQRSRQLSPPGMIVYTTVLISFHPVFVTKTDRAYRVACHYMEATRTVTADLEVSMLSTMAMTAAPAMPECRYEILVGGPTGQLAKFARVGEQIYHKWTCDSKDNAYCMRVHSCTVDDGQGNESYQVVNRQGCATDRFVLQNLDYLTDLMAGQETHVVKFADKASLFYSCQIELLSKASESANCASARPNCTEPGTLAVTSAAAATTATAAATTTVAAATTTTVAAAASPAATPPVSLGDEKKRRRLARHERSKQLAGDSVGKNFQVVGDMDLLRQHLTVLDLDDAPGDSSSLRTESRLHPSTVHAPNITASPTSVPSVPREHHSRSKISDAVDISGPICVSPLGFGLALFALLTIFLVALSTAIRYAVPVNRSKYDDRATISAEYSLPRHLSRHRQ